MGREVRRDLDGVLMGARGLIAGAVVAAALATATGAAAGVPAAGAGAALPAVAYDNWCRTSGLCTYEVRDARATPVALRSGRAAWAGVDEALTPAQVRAAGGPVAYYPTLIGAIAVIARVPGFRGGDIRLPAHTLGEIFSGEITNWNDKRIRQVNLRHQLPRNLPVTLCVPRRPSGEAYDFSDFLARSSGIFRQRVGGASTSPRWRGARIVREDQVTRQGTCVDGTPGAISFIDRADAIKQGDMLDVVAVGKRERMTRRARNGRRVTITEYAYTTPTGATMDIAARHAAARATGDLTVDLVNSAAKGAYPITVATWVAVRADRPMPVATRTTLRHFLSARAQASLPGLGYAPLPADLMRRARAQLAAAR